MICWFAPLQYDHCRDIESQEELLVPGMSRTDNMLRWGFIRKVSALTRPQVIIYLSAQWPLAIGSMGQSCYRCGLASLPPQGTP